jgi:predicted Zn-dependent protease
MPRTTAHLTTLCSTVALTALAACSKTPVTERIQFNLIPDVIMKPLGQSAYREMLAAESLEKGTNRHDTLKKVGKRVSKVANQPGYKWRYSLIRDEDTVNAWCLPGGKIAFYSGILPVLQNEAGMAFVMGHEVAHATARHGSERLSQQLAVLGGLSAVYLYMDNNTELSEETRGLIMGALGVGATVGFMLPFSRKHEKEADVIGMMYMARAGYPPAESVAVWNRMDKMSGGGGVPLFMSTHPSHGQRKRNLRDWMPQARKRYQRNALSEDTQRTLWSAK